MTSEQDDGLAETIHLLSSPVNAARLLRAIGEANRGKTTERELIELDKAGASEPRLSGPTAVDDLS